MAPVFEGINSIEELIGKDVAFRSFADKVAQGGRYKVSGISGSLTAFLAKSTFMSTGRSLLIAAESLKRAETFRDDLETLLGKEFVYFFPESGNSMGQESITIQAFQSHALHGLLGGDPSVVISTFRGLLEMVPPLEDLNKNRINLTAGDEIEIETLISRLTNIGYEREKMVSRPFEFSVRGGILDIFPISSEYPVRLEFFDDTIDSIREFEIVTQRSHKHIKNIMIDPDFLVENLWRGVSRTLLSVIPQNSMLWIDGYDKLAQFADDDPDIDLEEIKNDIEKRDGADFLSFTSPGSIRFKSSPQTRYRSSISTLSKDLHRWETNKDFVFVLCENDFHQERLSKTLENEGIAIETAPLSAGFNLPSVNLHVLTDHEIFPCDLEGFLENGSLRFDIVLLLSILHHYALSPDFGKPEKFLAHVDRITGKYLFLDMGQNHEDWFRDTLPKWDSDFIIRFIKMHTSFNTVLPLGTDTDDSGHYQGNYGRTLFVCFRK
ncbi:MAG: hypothetical protein IH978_04990 [Nitrospinae bacterium]|nr:hypothetical protein [Nitrospinota bacterium]